jgi:hypothetical protein
MPHPKKKSKTTKAQRLASRVTQRKKEKNEFEHLQYLQSQLDENGVPLDILNTDHELLNNEQKLIVGIVKMLKDIDLRSIAIYMHEHYNEEHISNLITNYYSNKENKTWADSFFEVTYKCLGILNLNHLLLDKILDEIEYIIDNVEQTDKPVMTDEILINIVNHYKMDTINLNELISACLLFYSQNQDYCMSGGKKKRVMKGGLGGVLLIIIGFICWVVYNWSEWEEERKVQESRRLAQKKEIDEEIFIKKALKMGYSGNREQLVEAGQLQAEKEMIAYQKMVKAADEKRALDEQRFINIALEMGSYGNRQQLIEIGKLEENRQRIKEEDEENRKRIAEEDAGKPWWQRRWS